MSKPSLLSGRKIDPKPIDAATTLIELIDDNFISYNSGRLREACQLFTGKILEDDVTVGLSITGALTPAGLGMTAFIPLIENGFVDWIVSTGANLYHDTHFAIGLTMHRGTFDADDVDLREQGVVRIYDIFFDYDVLISTDDFFREILKAPEFQKEMGTAEMHYRVGRYLDEREKILGLERRSLLAAAYRSGVPVYTSSPGDSSIGMNVAALALKGNGLRFDVSRDVNESAALVLEAKRAGGRSAAVILGGGSPKNFLLQTEPHIQEVLGARGEGIRLLHPDHRRPGGHGRSFRGHTRGGRELGQGGSRSTARLRGLLRGQHHRRAADDGLRHGQTLAAKVETSLRQTGTGPRTHRRRDSREVRQRAAGPALTKRCPRIPPRPFSRS